jgi:2-polyprenyl-3-methyl-5-hydroxy-6-metoxy-1,4-benzoquinol methylase
MSKPYQINNSFSFKKCPLCVSQSIIKQGIIRYSVPTMFSTSTVNLNLNPELYKCLQCYSAFSANIIGEEEAKTLYQQGESSNRWISNLFEVEKPRIVVSTLEPLLKAGSKVLDIGCAAGNFLDFAKKKQCLTYGLEYSKHNLDLLKKNGHVAYSDIKKLTEEYDLITAFDVIEHLYDVNEFINSCLDSLSPTGHLAIVTGDISSLSSRLTKNNWWYVSYPEHVVFPSIKYFQSHPRLKNIRLVHTFANAQIEARNQKYISRLKGMIGSMIRTRKFSGHFLGCDHILVIANKQDII